MQKRVTNVAEFLNENYSIRERKGLITRHRQKFGVNFRVRSKKKGAANPTKQAIYYRVRVNGNAATDASTGVFIEPGTWDTKTQQIKGSSVEVDEKNRFLAQIRNDLMTLFNDLRQQGVNVTAKMLVDLYRVNQQTPETLRLVNYYELFLSYHKNTVTPETIETYQSRLNLLKKYLVSTKQYNVTIDAVSPKWAMAYHRYILDRKNGLDHAQRAIKTIAKILDFAVVQDDIESNPLRSLRLPRSPQKPIKYLTKPEIEQLQNCPYFDERLQKAADCFLLQCFTGMAYNELVMFDAEKHIQIDSDGQEWIMIRRGKTGTLSTIPVIAPAKNLLEKYANKMPVISNQKLNDFIKEAAKVAGLKNADSITTHLARKTAGTYLLNHGVPLETVSKVLGHRSVKMTEMYYAVLLTNTIKQNFKNSGLL
ncbi:site-specific integrase [Runella slithyformis]|uniref:Integrase family protein n=1 Tax=Runella slithyformis (strain ATCC 29530 / DSM 19594 / LMG 11500 / NCIMB 11436 / LSU 4) TaxID=761193 RepID=A0A7U4E7G6_RUNSL|nr:site-specific integrase [Runella slithyformis]AEI50666.1 integrase family protein [Runella slithyformis DSM 19594]